MTVRNSNDFRAQLDYAVELSASNDMPTAEKWARIKAALGPAMVYAEKTADLWELGGPDDGAEAKLTDAQRRALTLLEKNGAIISGANKGLVHGGIERVSAGTIRALAKRGYFTLATSPDGTLMGRR